MSHLLLLLRDCKAQQKILNTLHQTHDDGLRIPMVVFHSCQYLIPVLWDVAREYEDKVNVVQVGTVKTVLAFHHLDLDRIKH